VVAARITAQRGAYMRKLVLILIGFIALITLIRGLDYTFEIDSAVIRSENSHENVSGNLSIVEE